ncbi:MAG: TIGR02147 family protein [Bacteriovoracaceae bacterium]
MEHFKNILQQEYLRRVRKNSHYSLRAYAQHLNVNHAILSMVLSGKRKITKGMVIKFSTALGLNPEEMNKYLQTEMNEAEQSFFLLQSDVFSFISEWYYDAILELTAIPHARLEPKAIAQILDITVIQATLALETLERLELLKKNDKGRYELAYKNSTNILDHNTTTSAQKNYQKSILEKSLEALETIDRKYRDHTSTTMAISLQDLPAAKELIRKFRQDLNAFMQKDQSRLDEVYQLQVSFFPLTVNQREDSL